MSDKEFIIFLCNADIIEALDYLTIAINEYLMLGGDNTFDAYMIKFKLLLFLRAYLKLYPLQRHLSPKSNYFLFLVEV
jgi:hypothetical protein